MAKKKTFREANKPIATGLNVSELAQLLVETVPDLKESYTRADIELALDDRGWLASRTTLSPELDPQSRTTLVTKSRLYWLRDPLAKQAVRLWTDYAMGTGITYTSDDAATQTAIDAFVKDRRNRRVLSSEGQRRSSKKLLIDGEIFFAIFQSSEGKVIRWVDPVQITDIITDPDDSEHILAYRRQLPPVEGRQPKALYYADWTCTAEDRTLAAAQKMKQEPVVLEDDVVIYHLPFDCLHQRGNGLLSCVVDWTREHRRFMEARVAITQALSKYAYKLTVKGGAGVVEKIKSRLQSTYAQSGATTVEKNPATVPGSTWVQNDGLDLQAVPKATGAGDAANDGNQLKLMVSAGTGIMLHYFGDPSTGNLATATAMELPMLKMFESYQELWKDAYADIFSIVMDDNENDGPSNLEDMKLVIDLPPILADDLTSLGTAMSSFANVWPELADEDEVLTIVLTAMRLSDVDEALKRLREVRKANQAKQDLKDKQNFDLANKKIAAGAPGPVVPVKESAEEIAALVGLTSAMREASQPSLPLVPAPDSQPINLTVHIENKSGGKVTKKAKATRDKSGTINFEMEEEDGSRT